MERKYFINENREYKVNKKFNFYFFIFEYFENITKKVKLLYFKNKYFYIFILFILFFSLIIIIPKDKKIIIKYKNYINHCNKLKRFKHIKANK